MTKVKAELDDIEDNLKQAVDILKEQVNKSHQSGNAMFFKEAIEGIPEFDGSTVPIKKWLQEIDDNAILFGWTELHTLVVAKKLLTGVAKLWLRSQPTFSTWPDLKEAITNEFDNPIDSRNIHILLTKRKKQQFESYYEYFLKMRELGSQGNLEEAVIIQYVIDGIPDQEFNKSILYGSTSYSDFKIKLKNYEIIKSKSKTNSTTSKVIPKPIDDKESKCFNCGKRGNLSHECRFKDLGKKCFSCNSFGHIANQCPTRNDIVIPANDAEEALKRLKHVLKRAEEYGLQINWEKCQILKSEITYLGHEIKDGVIRPSDDKVSAVKRFPELKTIKQLQSFLGLTGYFRKFIKNYSIIAKPLSDMLKTNANFMMGPDQKQAFQDLKQILTSKPVLKIYQVGARTELHTDASKFGFGAILLQEDVDKKMHPVHYMSKKTNEAQQKYSSYELEVLAVVEAVKKFRIYLLGIKFKILTDCSAFTMTLKKKDLTTRVARWALLLEEYDYTIEHRPGSGMKHVEALSRNPVSMMIQTDTLVEKIRNAQGKDPLIKALLVIVEEKQVYDGYFEENNLLWKEVEGDRTLVIPKGMEIEIIKLAHEEGHFGVQKNFEMLKKEYYITDLKSKIKKYIQNCIPCILSNRKHGKQEGMLHPISKGDTPLDTYHIDHLGPLASTRKDYNYLLVITDGFTKFTWIYPTKTTRTSEVIQKLECQQQIFEESIEHCCITTGVPRGNGQVERINHTIVSVLTKLSIDNPQEWHKHVRKLQKALNSTHQRSIRMSPFELLVRVKMRKEEDLRLLEMIEEDLALTFDEERDQKRKAAKQEILKIQEENRNTFNKKRKKAFVYKEGDLVVIQKTQFATKSKLYPKYIGPYKVIKIKPNDRYN
ncbi:hypothetical protein LAZ67_8001189 [Cordylochernes scorpioides]|uniref:RNA-directed DNA polymerase n=1 Tax=Cordylochernes scorpioides TaxID=51811 RepID=A0ABY6KRK3_9ARAC|nr:hypothetical protein LAZ67_8001189 [Cordylochernes scorpioides]